MLTTTCITSESPLKAPVDFASVVNFCDRTSVDVECADGTSVAAVGRTARAVRGRRAIRRRLRTRRGAPRSTCTRSAGANCELTASLGGTSGGELREPLQHFLMDDVLDFGEQERTRDHDAGDDRLRATAPSRWCPERSSSGATASPRSGSARPASSPSSSGTDAGCRLPDSCSRRTSRWYRRRPCRPCPARGRRTMTSCASPAFRTPDRRS